METARGRYRSAIWLRVKHGTAFATVGDPDIYGCLHGVMFAFEVKNDTGTLTKIQQYRLREITRAGGRAYGVHAVEDALRILDEIDANGSTENKAVR